MMDSELMAFNDVFQGLRRVLHLRGDEHEITQAMRAYFKALRRYPLSMVTAGAEQCLQRCKHFPKPAEWIDALPRPTSTAPELPAMTERESQEHRRAEQRGYEDEPCGCDLCQQAGVTHRYLRFVPEWNADGRDRRVRDPLSDRTVVAGHWAHGEELRRWYVAKEAFWTKAKAMGLKPEKMLPAVTQ